MLRIPSLLLILAPFAGAAQTTFDLHEVGWKLSPGAGGDFIRMEMTLNPLHDRDRVVVKIPLWRPGSYRYFKNENAISDLEARDQKGDLRSILVLDPRSWEVDTRGATSLKVTYRLRVKNEADAGKTPAIHLHGPASFLYLEDALQLPHFLMVDLPKGWDMASGHRLGVEKDGRFRSPNYDILVDCPIALGGMERHAFENHGKTFEVVLFGKLPEPEQFSRGDWLGKVEALVDAGWDLVGDFPFEKYVFLFLLNDIGGYSGLEHLNSTTIAYNHANAKAGRIAGMESVTSHEFFHLWNVKRIRPEALGPFDYSRDVRTRDLWWMEGITSYYTDILLLRSGLRDTDWFWKAQAGVILTVLNSPGYGKVSPERSSWTVWDPSPGAHISYYDQGQALGLLLDIEIRKATGNQRSLDDVVRFLHRWVNYPEAGYRDGDLSRAIRSVTGWDCRPFFERHIRGLVDLPLEESLPEAGLRVVWMRKGSPYLGLRLSEELEITGGSSLREGAFEEGDRILKIGKAKVRSRADLQAALKELEAGVTVSVQVRRGGVIKKVEFELPSRRSHSLTLQPDPDAPADARAIGRGILEGTPQSI